MMRRIAAVLFTLALAVPALGQSELSDGEVRKVDKEAKKITLKHGEIKSLDMPPMTMVFQVKDPAMLEKVEAGDKVRFQAEKAGNTFVVTSIEVAK
jgi:Cu(I)/Ag(I) efflux system protein CusF